MKMPSLVITFTMTTTSVKDDVGGDGDNKMKEIHSVSSF